MLPNTMKPGKPSLPPVPIQNGHRMPPSGAKTGMTAGSHCTSPDHQEIHRRKIAERAYLLAEKRNFSGGDPIQDWLIAEQAVCCPT
jgi:hypothetical protein